SASDPAPTSSSTPASAPEGEVTTVVSCRVPTSQADQLVARAKARGIHPQEFLAEIIGRSLENE
ncbi:MAG: ribonuclease H family protein, partial [Brevibacterium sp.]